MRLRSSHDLLLAPNLQPEACRQLLEKEGMTLLHHSREQHTCWAVVEGSINYNVLAQEVGGLAKGPVGTSDQCAASTSSQGSSVQLLTLAPEKKQRFVLLRGVQWNAPETVVTDVWRTLGAVWPVRFAASMTAGRGGGLVCHAGVGDVALELFTRIAPFLRNHGDTPLVFAGHSLGGSLATLLWALSLLHGHRSPDRLHCHSFGSPPVLAHDDGGSDKVLALLGAQPSSCRSWIQEFDPVPRAMMAADPYFSALMQQSTVRALLDARTWLSGNSSSAAANRFLYDHMGEMFLIKGGCEVLAVTPGEEAALMRMTYRESFSQPARSVSYWLDHHHSSYAHDLGVAAGGQLRQALAQERALTMPRS